MTVIRDLLKKHGLMESLDVGPTASGSLDGLTFVVKDLIDVSGCVTGAGNPDFRKSRQPARHSAPVVSALLSNGARLIGKSATDELACSLDGINEHYGAPVNPLYPDRIAGGSSSGSASMVAAGLADFSIGTDTVGSVRVPAAYCGLFGFRPTLGSVALDGVQPLGPTFDTVGWFARDADVLRQCGAIILEDKSADQSMRHSVLRVVDNLFSVVEGDYLDCIKDVRDRFEKCLDHTLSIGLLDIWSQVFSIIRSRESWAIYGDWIESSNPVISGPVLTRIMSGRDVTGQEEALCRDYRTRAQQFIGQFLEAGQILCIPTTWRPPPPRLSDQATLASNRKDAIRLSIVATLCGLPQVVVPVRSGDQTLSISFLGSPGSDRSLLDLVCSIFE